MSSYEDIKKLITAAPAVFTAAENYKLKREAVSKVLVLYMESHKYELTARERGILRQRLLQAARVLDELRHSALDRGFTNTARKDMSTFKTIAQQLSMSTHDLSRRVLNGV